MYLLYSLCLFINSLLLPFIEQSWFYSIFFSIVYKSEIFTDLAHAQGTSLSQLQKIYKPNIKKYLQNVLSVRNYGDLESFGIYLVHPTLAKTVCNLRRLVTTFIDSVFQHEFIYVFMSIFELRASRKTYYWPVSKSRFLCWNPHLHMRLEYLSLISGSCMYFQIILT